MVKKLVKYGNSNALIFDRAILELLNISEGSKVKLRTDGKSLIITPIEAIENQALSMTGYEMARDIVDSRLKKANKDIETDPVKKQQSDQWKPGTDNFIKLTEAFKKIMSKYSDDINKFSTEAFKQDVEKLSDKHNGDRSSDGFMKEFNALRIKHAPNIINFDREMKEAKKALEMPDYL